MLIHKLTEEQREMINQQEFAPHSYFAPIQDANDNWVISQETVQQCENEDFMWVKDLPMIEFEPKILEEE